MTKILNVENLEKSYDSGAKKLTILKDITFSVEAQETFAIVGPSGSGKTTLLGLCAGLDQPDAGIVSTASYANSLRKCSGSFRASR